MAIPAPPFLQVARDIAPHLTSDSKAALARAALLLEAFIPTSVAKQRIDIPAGTRAAYQLDIDRHRVPEDFRFELIADLHPMGQSAYTPGLPMSRLKIQCEPRINGLHIGERGTRSLYEMLSQTAQALEEYAHAADREERRALAEAYGGIKGIPEYGPSELLKALNTSLFGDAGIPGGPAFERFARHRMKITKEKPRPVGDDAVSVAERLKQRRGR